MTSQPSTGAQPSRDAACAEKSSASPCRQVGKTSNISTATCAGTSVIWGKIAPCIQVPEMKVAFLEKPESMDATMKGWFDKAVSRMITEMQWVVANHNKEILETLASDEPEGAIQAVHQTISEIESEKKQAVIPPEGLSEM